MHKMFFLYKLDIQISGDGIQPNWLKINSIEQKILVKIIETGTQDDKDVKTSIWAHK